MFLEGGYVNNPVDKGGRTNFGLTEEILASFNTKNGANYQTKTLTPDQAKTIYYMDFFIPICAENNLASYYHYFDLCVNSGYGAYKQCDDETKGDIRKIIKWRKNKYAEIVKKDPSQSIFIKGWYNRINLINQHFGVK